MRLTTAPSISRVPLAFSILLATTALLVSVLLTQPLRAQTTETVINDPCEICKPNSVVVADFDGGAKDLIVGGTATGRLSFYSGTGSGSGTGRLGSRSVISTSVSSPEGLASGDLTGGSSRDLVVADAGANEVLLVPGNGDGTFGSPTTLGTPDSPGDVVVADIDGSNGLDVAVAGAFAVEVYFNNGSGSFSTTTLNGGDTSIDAGDLGNDGDMDLVAVVASSDELVAFEWDSGSFTERTVTTGFGSPQHVELVSANPSTDSDLDVVAYSDNFTSDPNLAWFSGNGDGTFNSTANNITTSFAEFFALITGDYTGNGNSDLVTVGNDANLYENNGTGFNSASSFDAFDSGAGAAVATNFTSGDTDLDLVGTPVGTDLAGFRKGDGSGGFSSETLVSPPDLQVPTFGETLLESGDVDNSGSKDVIMAGEDAVVWYSNDGSGQFGNRRTVANTSTPTLVVKDVDSDGRADIFFQEFVSFESSLMRYEWDGAGSFSKTQLSTETPRQLAIADFDQDDQYDVVIGNSSGLHVGINQGGGSFNFSTVNSSVSSIDDLAVADVNEDDALDILFANSFDDKIAYHAGNGSGGFGSEQTAVSPFVPLRVLARDLNDDGNADLVVDGATVYLYDPGTNSFGSGTDYFGGGLAITLADVSGDTAPDLIQGTDWWANDGSGSFGSATSYASVPGVTAVASSPIDSDTDLDPLTASNDLDKLSWFENQGSVLPVELASFEGTQTGKDVVRLTWTTASETNNAGFRVQKKASTGATKPPSANSEGEWQTLGRVGGAGTTDQPQTYQFTAEKLGPGTHPFRLQQIDLDGTTRALAPVTVDVGMRQPVRLTAPAPNPVQDRATLSFAVKEAQETTIALYNVLGQKVATLYDGTPVAGEAQLLQIDAGDLASGTYVVRLRAADRTKIQRVTVVH